MGNELVSYSIDDMNKMANALAVISQKQPRDIFALMLIAQAEGIHPAMAEMQYDIIEGRPALKGSSIQSRFQKSGGKLKFIERTEYVCEIEFTHPTVEEPLRIRTEFSKLDKSITHGKDGTLKKNWRCYKARMLNIRCMTEGVRTIYPACLFGMYTDDEVHEIVENESKYPVETTYTEIDTSYLRDPAGYEIDAGIVPIIIDFLNYKKWLGDGQGLKDLEASKALTFKNHLNEFITNAIAYNESKVQK